MTKELYIGEKEGYKIVYNRWEKMFVATKEDVTLKAKTEPELDAMIKEDLRETRRFKPLDVIKVDDDKVGRIPS